MNKEQIQQKFEEILKGHGYEFFEDGMLLTNYLTKNDLIEFLEEGFNLGLDVSADNAEADTNIVSTDTGDYSEIYVLKNSILKFKL